MNHSLRGTLSETAREILAREEYLGEKIANRIRLFVGLAIVGPTLYMAFDAGLIGGIITNSLVMAVYFLVTGIHFWLLRNPENRWRVPYRYVTVIVDSLLIINLILGWAFIEGNGNAVFAIKNPSMFVFTLLLVFPAIQFRQRMVYLTLAIILMFYFTIVAWGFAQGLPQTSSWAPYILGDKVVVMDVLFTRPIIFIGIALIVNYAIRHSISMASQIGDAEAKRMVLSRYFSPSVVEEITENPGEIQKARRQKVTVLFLDIRNFTSMSESLNEEKLVEWLSDFRSEMTKAVFETGGTLDKFIGDAVMATFGTPMPAKEAGQDNRNAFLAAKDMLARIKLLNERWAGLGIDPVRVGIGIHCGEVFAGNIGTEDRMEYTVIGDAVNTASRIESLCKKLDRDLLVSSEVAADLDMSFLEKMPEVQVKGKAEPLQVYSIDSVDDLS